MAIQRDKIIVVDIEATCWDVTPPPDGQLNEIIEIGLCIYNVDDHELSGKRSIFVKPTASKVSEFCTQLTTITQKQVDEHGISFAEACDILVKEYNARKLLWTSWGGYDHKMFRQQCRRMEIGYPFGDKHMNLKSVFADHNQGRRVGMARALSIAGIDLVGTHHRGDDDAWNIGQLLKFLIEQKGQDIIRRYW